MKELNFTTPDEFHTKIGMLFNAAIALPLLPFVWLYLEIKNNDFQPGLEYGLTNTIVGYLIPVFAGGLVLKGLDYLNKQIVLSYEEDALKNKLLYYGQGLKRFYILVGVAGALMSCGLYFTASGVLIVSYVILLFAMSFYFPKPKKYVKDLKLEGDMKDIILNQKDFQF